MKNFTCFRIPIVLAALLLLTAAEAATRFVDGTSGSDAGNCLNAASPCLTINRALEVAQAGDVIDIADAVYTEVLEIDRTMTLAGRVSVPERSSRPIASRFRAATTSTMIESSR